MDNINKINSEEEEFTLTLTLDNGMEIECAIIATFPVDERNYIALLPLNHHDVLDPEEVFLYRCATIGSKNTVNLDTIKTDSEYNKVADAFDALIEANNK